MSSNSKFLLVDTCQYMLSVNVYMVFTLLIFFRMNLILHLFSTVYLHG